MNPLQVNPLINYFNALTHLNNNLQKMYQLLRHYDKTLLVVLDYLISEFFPSSRSVYRLRKSSEKKWLAMLFQNHAWYEDGQVGVQGVQPAAGVQQLLHWYIILTRTVHGSDGIDKYGNKESFNPNPARGSGADMTWLVKKGCKLL